jgi:hypothetical protein
MFFQKTPMDIVELTLKARSWKYVRIDSEAIMTGFATSNGNCFLLVRHDKERNTLLFLCNPAKAPVAALEALSSDQPPILRIHEKNGSSPEQVNRVNEFLLHQNYRLLLGAFERDASDGEIRFRIALPFPDGAPTQKQVNWCIEMACSTVSQTMQELAKVTSQVPTMI